MHRICSTFVTNTEFPLFVIHRIRHQGPGYTGSNTGSHRIDQLADYKKHKSSSIRSDRKDKHQDIRKYTDKRTDSDCFFLSESFNDLADKRHIENQSDIGNHSDNTGDLRVLKVRLEHNLQRRLCSVHTDKHTYRRQGSSYSRTVTQEVSDRLNNIKLLSFLTDFDLSFHTDLCIPNHKLERNKSDHTHNQSDQEDSVSHQVITCIINKERQKNLTCHTAQGRTDRAPGRQLCTLNRIRGNQGQQRTVRNIRDRVKCIPQNITSYEQNILYHTRRTTPWNITKRSCHQQSD